MQGFLANNSATWYDVGMTTTTALLFALAWALVGAWGHASLSRKLQRTRSRLVRRTVVVRRGRVVQAPARPHKAWR